ncbi:response regulator [Pseudanabaena sp. FACHB-1998]|uniref:response regulator n=1 Tax=Pseudanabaena sp. FACHB-1998 TaxID=2692858 RepID=UPI0016806CD5|nr:response regulator [Pseudanabaena sp. FACHB-1998]MBD2179019.1 response regulator [Pseudanabaena sp. FACHB-1998]
MQGTLREIDVQTIIHLIEFGQRTGELLIESSEGKFWFLFFHNGELIYATDTDSNLTRLRDYLHGLGLDHALDQLATSKLGINVLEYGQIWALLESKILNPCQAKAILESTILEVLFDVLGLYQGTFVFEISPALTPKLSTLKFSEISAHHFRQLQQWKYFYPIIQSINQCPILWSNDALPHLSKWIDGKTSIRQLCRYSGQSILTIGQALYDAIAAGEVSIPPLTLKVPQEVKVKSPKILCIDDSVTIGRAVEYILHNHGYQVMSISSPIKALSLIFQQKPDLVLCDIAMPELDGYELCAMLRKSSVFAKVPIIMLTGKDGFIDRVKARMVGATEYLTKPFGEKELLTTVEKYSKR